MTRTNPSSRYAKAPIEQSVLFGQSSRKRLAQLIDWSDRVGALEAFARRSDNYQPYAKKKPNGKVRMIEPPQPTMMRLHSHVFGMLSKIQTPPYLHSGVKGKSYLTNAAQHAGVHGATITMDLEEFYVSTKWGHIYRFFHKDLRCSPDFSALLARICCFENHLPTGSPASQLLAFFAHRKMFEEVNQFVTSRGGVFTVYVDDLTITMVCGGHRDAEAVSKIVARHGLRINVKKTHVYGTRDAKAVTGHILHPNGVRASHAKHMGLKLLRDQANASDATQKVYAKLVGVLEHIATIDPHLSPSLRSEARGWRRLASAGTVAPLTASRPSEP